MKAIEMMNEEHKNILRMLKVVRKACFNILNGEEIVYEDFDKMIDFIKNYADNHHHRKEEDVLFIKMIAHMDAVAEKLVKHGMLVEHDFGRLYVRELKEALERVKAGDEESKLDVIANAISYTHLLARHIDKEDNVVYKFAERELNDEILSIIDEECEKFQADNNEVQDKYLSILEELELKY